MAAAQQAGVEVLALADHNDADWLETMVDAGSRAGIVVFPGVEITTGSGADGVHLILIGDQSRTRDDFNALLSGVCGYSDNHPRFDPVQNTPASSPRTATDIMDDLPEGYLVLAPHVFNENGLVSRNTVAGDIRWKILHHDRLNAIDIGDRRTLTDPTNWKSRFVKRELDHFPALPGMAFVSTRDAYDLDRLGARWTWIRMSDPTIEGLRQAFLDHEARVICDWDERYSGASTPNDVGHAWIERISLSGLTTSEETVEATLHARLNVLIRGRGSGKSTIVAGLRCLYGTIETLPPQARAEATELRDAVFGAATVEGHHRLPHSGEEQTAEWTAESGSRTTRLTEGEPTAPTPTEFQVRIINQKELFERAAHSRGDPYSTSRNLLALVDDALTTGAGIAAGPREFAASLNEAQATWIGAARAYQAELEGTAQRDVVAARVGELARQVAAFDSDESRSRRERNDRLLAQSAVLDRAATRVEELLSSVEEALGLEPEEEEAGLPDDPVDIDFESLRGGFRGIELTFRRRIGEQIAATREELLAAGQGHQVGAWAHAHSEAVPIPSATGLSLLHSGSIPRNTTACGHS